MIRSALDALESRGSQKIFFITVAHFPDILEPSKVALMHFLWNSSKSFKILEWGQKLHSPWEKLIFKLLKSSFNFVFTANQLIRNLFSMSFKNHRKQYSSVYIAFKSYKMNLGLVWGSHTLFKTYSREFLLFEILIQRLMRSRNT